MRTVKKTRQPDESKRVVPASPAPTQHPEKSESPGAVPHLHRALGNQAVQRLLEAHVIQPKLTVNAPGDKYEREADRVADTVMRMPEPTASVVNTEEAEGVDRIQRMCPRCQRRHRQGEPLNCPECEEKLQRREASSKAPAVDGEAERQIQVLRGGGQPLPEAARSFFEPRFGQDFADVRVHTGERAAASATEVNARAYTVGRDIVFGRSEYVTGSSAGRRLLAHELAHVVQQDAASTREPAKVQPRGRLGSPLSDSARARGCRGNGEHAQRLSGRAMNVACADHQPLEPAPALVRMRAGDVMIQRQEHAPPEGQEEERETVHLDLRPAAAQLRGIARLSGLAALLDPAAVARNFVAQEVASGAADPDRAVASLPEPPATIPTTASDPRPGRAALSAVGVGASFLPGFVPGGTLVENPVGFSRGGINPNRIAFGLRGATESPLFGSQHLSLRSEQQLITQRGMIFGAPTAGWRFESYSGLNFALGEWGEIEAGQMQVLAEGEYAEVETQGIGRIRLRLGPVGVTYQNDHDFLAMAGIHLPVPILGSDKDQGLSAALDLSLDLTRVGRAPHLFGNVWWEGVSAGLEINTGIPLQHGTPRSELPVYDLEQIAHSEIDRGEIRVCGQFLHRPSGALLDLCGGWNASAIRTAIQNDLVHARVDAPDIPIDPAVGPYSFPTLDLTLTIPF